MQSARYVNYEQGLNNRHTLRMPALLKSSEFLFKQDQNGKFFTQLVFDNGPDLEAIKALMKAIVQNRQAKDPSFPRSFSEIAFPLKSGTKIVDEINAKRAAEKKEVRKYPWLNGKAVITARSKFQPELLRFVNGVAKAIPESERQAAFGPTFYNGVGVFATLQFNTYEKGASPAGVNCRLIDIVSTGQGERLGGDNKGAAAEARYSHMTGHIGKAVNEDPSRGHVEQEIPF